MALFECPRCGTKLPYASKEHPCRGGKSSDGGGEATATAERPAGTGDLLAGDESGTPNGKQYRPVTPAGQPASDESLSAGSIGRKVAGIAPGPSEAIPVLAAKPAISPTVHGGKAVGRTAGSSPATGAKSKRGRPQKPNDAPISRATLYRRRLAEQRSKEGGK